MDIISHIFVVKMWCLFKKTKRNEKEAGELPTRRQIRHQWYWYGLLPTYLPTYLVLKCKKFREWTCEISKEAESRAENLFTSGSSLEATLARRVRKVLRNFLLNQPKKSEEKILFRLNWDWFTLEEEAVCDANIKMDSFRNYFSSFQDGFFQELSFILPKLTLLGTIVHPFKMDLLGTVF